jgi:hypothetical protein
MTLTGIAADLRGGQVATAVRRSLAVGTMLAGALGGALLVLHPGAGAALGAAVGVLTAVGLATVLAARGEHPWQQPG